MSNIGTTIAMLRKSKNMTRKQLAELSGVHVNSIRNSELGEIIPNMQTAEMVLNALGYELSVRKRTEA